MDTINGSLNVRIEGNNVYIRVDDCDVPTRATAELSHDNVTSLRATLEEALIRLDYPEQHKGLGNDTLEQP
jgi:hypothetical protein